ncbi:MAG: O-antigen polymerase [Ramlibacter sp.]|nr:O-antigen polymerase [Ramlibacter sp.]
MNNRAVLVPLTVVLVGLPWINPFAPGPSPAIVPWLASAACALLLALALLAAGVRPRLVFAMPALALAGWAALSHFSISPDIVMLAGGLVLIALAASVLSADEVAHGVQTGVLVAACGSAAMGLVQYFGASGAVMPWVSGARAGEAYANLRQPNLYATLCWLGGAVLLWGGLRLPRALAAAAIVLLAVGCAASASRTGLVEGLLLTAMAAAWPSRERRWRLALCMVAGAAYLAAAWLLPLVLMQATGSLPERTLWGRLGGGEGCSGRLVLWSNVLRLIALRPLAGWGWGELDYAHFMTLYPGARFCDILDNAHNLPLHLAVELGLPAALLACGAALAWAWRRQPWREADARRQLAWAWIAVMLLHGMLEYPLWYGPFQVLFGISVGWLAASQGAARQAEVRRGPALAAIGVLLLATCYAAWDYARVSQIYIAPEERRAAWREDTLSHVRASWLFSGQARFAETTLSGLSRDNAEWMHGRAEQMLHYSPEPRIVERLIESATMTGREDEAVLHLARFRAAFPQEYAKWREEQRMPPQATAPP